MPRCTNQEMGALVAAREEFVNSKGSAYAAWEGHEDFHSRRYVVYSYGPHFPMYIWDETTRRWFENADKYSVTTTSHMRCAAPGYDVSTTKLSTKEMQRLAERGATQYVIDLIAA